VKAVDRYVESLPLGTTFSVETVPCTVGNWHYPRKAVAGMLRSEAQEGHGRLEVVTLGGGGTGQPTVYKKIRAERLGRRTGHEVIED
jgi:hypothetical protein